MALNIHEKGFSISKTILVGRGWKYEPFCVSKLLFWRQIARHGNSLVVRRVSQGRIIIVLFWTKYAVPRQIKPGILKLTTSRGQRNLCTVFIFVSCEEKGCYRIVSQGHQNFDCRSYCGLSRRMQGKRAKSKNRMQIIESPRESDNISVFWENLDENKRQILVKKVVLSNTCFGAWKIVKSFTIPVCLSQFVGVMTSLARFAITWRPRTNFYAKIYWIVQKWKKYILLWKSTAKCEL